MEMLARHELPAFTGTGVLGISCRTSDGSTVWYVIEGVGGAAIVDAYTGLTLTTFAEPTASLGLIHALSYDYEGKVVNRHDLATDEIVPLYQNATGELRGVYPAPNPFDGTTALVETRYPDGGPVESTLFIYDEAGAVVFQTEIPMEASVPTWLDPDTVAVGATDFDTGEKRVLYVVDASRGAVSTLDGWQPWETTGNADEVFGIVSGGIWRGDPTTGEVEHIGSIADESATALLVLQSGTAIEVEEVSPPAPVGGVIPPLTPEDGIEVVGGGGPIPPETIAESNDVARLAFFGVIGAAVLAGLAVWRRDRRLASETADAGS
jgi:hypothetical protein